MADDDKERSAMLRRLKELRKKYGLGEFAPKRNRRRPTGDYMTDREEKLVERARDMGIPNMGMPYLPPGSPRVPPARPNTNPYDVP